MSFLDRIVDWLLDIALFFLDLSHEVRDWGSWANWAADFLVGIADAFAHLAVQFERFNDWVEYASDMVEDILNLSQIKQALKTWLDYATWAWNWISDAWANVRTIIDDWWGTVTPTILGWIDIATEGLDDLKVAWDNFWTITFPEWTNKLDSLVVAWDNFWTVTFPTMVSFTWLTTWWNEKLLDINSLLRSWTLELEPFWAGWQDIRDKVFEFFTDPVEFLWARFTDWFLGPEE